MIYSGAIDHMNSIELAAVLLSVQLSAGPGGGFELTLWTRTVTKNCTCESNSRYSVGLTRYFGDPHEIRT